MTPPDTNTIAATPSACTQPWTRLTPPGITAPQIQLPSPVKGLLAPAIHALCIDHTPRFTIDVLAYSGKHCEQYAIRPVTVNTQDLVQADQIDFGGSIAEDVRTHGDDLAVAVTAQTLATALPDRVGLSYSEIDLGAVGWQPTATLRTVATTDVHSPTSDSSPGAFADFLDSLHSAEIPHVSRTRIHPTDGEHLHIRQQTILTHRAAEVLSPRDRCRLVDSTPEELPADYDLDGITTTLALLRNADIDTKGNATTPQNGCRVVANTTRANALTSLVCTAPAYPWVLTGSTGNPTHELSYDAIDASPTLSVAADRLSDVFGYAPNYGGWNWTTTSENRNRPVIRRQYCLREPAGSPSNSGQQAQPQSKPPNSSNGNPQLADTAWRRFRDHGDTLVVPTTPRSGVAFTRSPRDGCPQPVIMADDGIPRAALSALLNESTGFVTVVAPTEAVAQDAYQIGRMPVQPDAAPDGWIGLYTHPDSPIVSDGLLSVLSTHRPYTWRVNANEDLQLTCGGDVLATGTITGGVSSTAIRWVKPTDAGCTLIDSDGSVIATGRTPTEISQTHQVVFSPVLPRERCFQPRIIAFAVTNGQLRYVEPRVPRSDMVDVGGVGYAFAERHTERATYGEEPLTARDLRDTCSGFYRRDTSCLPPSRDTFTKMVSQTGRLQPPSSTTRPVGVRDEQVALRRRWRWPTQSNPPFHDAVEAPSDDVRTLANRLQSLSCSQ